MATVDEGKKEAHCVLVSPDNKYLYIPYVKGNLALLQYRFDASSGTVTPLDPLNANPPVGTGPRHLVYHPTLPMVYFTNEQGIGLSTYERLANGQLSLRQDIAILPEGMSKEGLSASDLEITPDGKFIFAGLRGHSQDFDRIARYRVREDGQAELLGLTPTDKIPWGLALSPDGRYLLVSATEHIRLPEYIDRQGLETWVRRFTERGLDLRQHQLGGSRSTSMVKGLTRAIAFQQALIRAEGWPEQG